MTFTVPDIINSAGVALILLAFFLLITKKVGAENSFYLLLNLFGAALACVGSILINAYPFVLLEGVWSLVALYGLMKKIK